MNKIGLLTVLFIFSASSLFASAYGEVNSGNRLYKKGEYDKAIEKYRDAKIAAPSDDTIDFNMGNALLKEGKYDEAESEYNKALYSKNNLIKERSFYNLGNNAVLRQKDDEALEYYKKALDINPNDINAKYNIEFLKLLKTNPSAVKNPREGNESKENKGQKAKEMNANEQKGKEEKEGKQSEENKKQGLTKEDAERILQYYNDAERQAAEKHKMRKPSMPKVDEDW